MQKGQEKQWGIKSKLWLVVDGRPVIGEGRVAMLEAIHRHGSIIQASQQIGVSYRKVRGAIRDMEHALGQPMVSVFRGGEEGGGARLTAAAQDLIASYARLTSGFQKEMDARFEDIFR